MSLKVGVSPWFAISRSLMSAKSSRMLPLVSFLGAPHDVAFALKSPPDENLIRGT